MGSVRFLYPEFKPKALTMSYDDGVVQDRRLVELFNRHGIRGTFHLNSATFDQGNRISSAEVATLYQGHEVACHSCTHPFLERLPRQEALREIWEDRRRLEELCGYPVIGMSYPYGTWNAEVVEIARAAGIVYSRDVRTTGGFGLPLDFMHWEGTCHHRDMLNRADAFLKQGYMLGLFYVWGHAYEFDNNDNWGDIEEFCKMMAHRDNVWYATNIEVYRVIQAIRAAVVSCDGRMIYNPSAETLWAVCDERKVKIGPGETVRF